MNNGCWNCKKCADDLTDKGCCYGNYGFNPPEICNEWEKDEEIKCVDMRTAYDCYEFARSLGLVPDCVNCRGIYTFKSVPDHIAEVSKKVSND